MPFPTSFYKRMLGAMAVPMPGFEPHEVGAGFVSEEIAKAFLLNLTVGEFVKHFVPTKAALLLDDWTEASDHLVHAAVETFQDKGIGREGATKIPGASAQDDWAWCGSNKS